MAYKQLTAEERYQIEALKREGFNHWKWKAIAFSHRSFLAQFYGYGVICQNGGSCNSMGWLF